MTTERTRTDPAPPRQALPAGIWVLGFVSLLMDVSSEMIHSLLPLFMVGTLGMSVVVVGLIEGLAESTALTMKVFSGVISDYVGRRKLLAVIGYGLGALTKPLFALAPGAGLVFTARMLDRVGKGIRGAPRDALVPLVMVAMNGVYAAAAYPFGKLADRMAHTRLLLWGLAVLIAADLVLAASNHWIALLAGVALWGVHMGMTQGLLAAMVADVAPADLRGTAFGFFNLMSGLALLLASLTAGVLWERFGATTTFLAGAGFSTMAMIALLVRNRQAPPA